MYEVGQEIEFLNGQLARVVWTASDGTFIIKHEQDGYAACWYDQVATGEEVWCFLVEFAPWTALFEDARLDLVMFDRGRVSE